MKIKKVLSLIIAVVMTFSLAACGGGGDTGTVATVNDVKITRGEVSQFVNIYAYIQGYDPSTITTENKQSMLGDYVDMEVMAQYLDGKGTEVVTSAAAADIDGYIAQAHENSEDFLTQYSVTDDALKNFYKKQYYSSAFFEELSTEMMGTDLEARAQEYYDNNKETYKVQEDEVQASHIIVETEEKAQEVLDKLNSGSDFAEMAKEYSTDGSASNGGDLGFFKYGDMVEDFSKAAFALEVGQMSGIVKSEFGYHIIKCTAKRTAGEYESFDDAYSEIYYAIYQEEYDKKMETIKADMKVDIGNM